MVATAYLHRASITLQWRCSCIKQVLYYAAMARCCSCIKQELRCDRAAAASSKYYNTLRMRCIYIKQVLRCDRERCCSCTEQALRCECAAAASSKSYAATAPVLHQASIMLRYACCSCIKQVLRFECAANAPSKYYVAATLELLQAIITPGDGAAAAPSNDYASPVQLRCICTKQVLRCNGVASTSIRKDYAAIDPAPYQNSGTNCSKTKLKFIMNEALV
jgi:hypothetical protein